MRKSFFLVKVLLMLTALSLCAADKKSFAPETTIWFDAPAKNFTESTLLGNGRLGAMRFGGVNDERIVLNESSVWSGSRQDADRPDAYKVLSEIQRLLLDGKNSEAEALVNANFTCKGPGSSGASGDGQYAEYLPEAFAVVFDICAASRPKPGANESHQPASDAKCPWPWLLIAV